MLTRDVTIAAQALDTDLSTIDWPGPDPEPRAAAHSGRTLGPFKSGTRVYVKAVALATVSPCIRA